MLREGDSGGPHAGSCGVRQRSCLVHVVLPALLLLALGARLKPLFQSQAAGAAVLAPRSPSSGLIIVALLAVVSPSLGGDRRRSRPSAATLAWGDPGVFPPGSPSTPGSTRSSTFSRRAADAARGALQIGMDRHRPHVGAVRPCSRAGVVPARRARRRRLVDRPDGKSSRSRLRRSRRSPCSSVSSMRGREACCSACCVHAAVDFLPNLPEFLKTWAV